MPYGGPSAPFGPRQAPPLISTRSPAPGSPKFSRKEMQASGLPTDPSAVSVKDLVKVLGEAYNWVFYFNHNTGINNLYNSIVP